MTEAAIGVQKTAEWGFYSASHNVVTEAEQWLNERELRPIAGSRGGRHWPQSMDANVDHPYSSGGRFWGY